MKNKMMHGVVQRAAFATALLVLAGQATAQDMLYENYPDGYAWIESYIWPNGTNIESADDFTASGSIERIWIYGGNCCMLGCSYPTDIVELTIRIYADDGGQPGDLLVSYVWDGDDPNFDWDEPAGPRLLDVTLPEPLVVDGSYFISAQPEFTDIFCWHWTSSNTNNPVGSALWTRENGGPWEPYQGSLGPLNADLAFALIGTPNVPDPPPVFVDDGCDSEYHEFDVPDFQPGQAGIPDVVEGVSNMLNDLVALSPTEVWAVGSYGYSELGPGGEGQSFSLVLFYDGATWTPVPSPSPLNAYGLAQLNVEAVDAVSSNLIYAAGMYASAVPSGPDTFVMRWDGSEWEHIVSPGQSGFGATGFLFEAVEAIDAQNVWFGGQFNDAPGAGHPRATMVHYDGSTFTKHSLPIDPNITTGAHRIRAISALSPDDIWAAGSAGGIAAAVGASYVAHWDGSSWQHMPTPELGVGEIVRDIVAIAPDDVWICGRYNIIPDGGGPVIPTPLFLHWDGQQWEQFDSPAFASDLVVFSSDRIYGVAGEQLVYWNGSEWGLVGDLDDDLTHINLHAIAKFGECDLLTVGSTVGTYKDTRAARYELQSVPGDLDGDGFVGVSDLLQLLAAWGPCDGSPCPADIDGNGAVNVSDLLMLLANWG